MEIQGAAFVGKDPLLGARAAQLVARAAARAALPLGIVRLDHRLRSAVAAFEAGLGTPVRDADALRALARSTVAAGRPTFLLDDLRWRAWAALSTGAAFILCPDAAPENASALSTMGFAVIELPERSITDSDGDRELWEFLEQPLREAGLDVVGGGNSRDDTEELDLRILLQGYAGRASEIIAERFVQGLHHTAAVIVDAQGNCWPGLGVEGPSSTAACAHAAALSAAILGGAAELVYTVGVRHPRASGASGGTGEYSLMAPCASCGEALLDAAPDLRSVVRVGGRVGSASVAALMAVPS